MKGKRFFWNSLAGRMLLVVFVGFVGLIGFYRFGASNNASPADAGRAIFNEQCQSCHTIGGGDLVGPDLNGVLDRRDRDWVARFISSPDWVIAEGDPIALELLAEYNGVAMPNLAMTDDDVESLLVYFEAQTSLTGAAEALPSGKASRGEKYFTGAAQFENEGTPCMGCHSVGSTGDFGGGTLGPDLTHVYARYGDAGLTSAIQNISFPTMKNTYAGKSLTPQEAADLLAYFAGADGAGNEGSADAASGMFLTAGIGGALALFLVMAFFWPRQSLSQTERLRKKADADSRRHS